jgi:hypothetical protein
MIRRLSLGVHEVRAGAGRAEVRGEVWLGPVVVGDAFTAASDGTGEESVDLRVVEIAEPAGAQEVGRVARVVMTVTGEGIESLRAGVVLLGEADNRS